MRCFRILPLLLLLLITACDKPQPEPLQVGDHAIMIHFPKDWEHVSYGDRHQFRQDLNRISLEDMGRLGYIDLALERAMVKLREDGRRENAWRDSLQINGRDARMVQTWDHLSHQYPKRYLFVVNNNSLLVVYTQSGQFETMEAAFTELTASLAFADSLGVPGDRDKPE
jgi:hypothetical protein